MRREERLWELPLVLPQALLQRLVLVVPDAQNLHRDELVLLRDLPPRDVPGGNEEGLKGQHRCSLSV